MKQFIKEMKRYLIVIGILSMIFLYNVIHMFILDEYVVSIKDFRDLVILELGILLTIRLMRRKMNEDIEKIA